MRFHASSLSLFAFIAVVLAAVGVYGLMNYAVADRIHEIGIRMSLGASRRGIMRMVVLHGMKIASAGVVIGLAGAFAATRLLQRFLFGVEPWDPLTFALVTVATIVISLAACAIPAWRATRIDPIAALRRE